MLLPTTETTVLILLAISMLCLGAWASTLKAVKKWRFEFMGYDFAWGTVIAALIAAFVFGMWDPAELTFEDNFLLAAKRKMAWAVVSGGVFMLANILLLAAISVSRMTVAFAMAFSTAWAIGAVWMFFASSQVNPMLLFSGVAILLVTCVLAAVGYRWHLEGEQQKAAEALRADPRAKKPKARPAGRGMVLAVVAGLFYGLAYPVLNNAAIEEDRVSSYGIALLMSAGIFGSAILYVPFFLNFPVQGEPLPIRRYFKGSLMQHMWGLLAGVLWITGILAWLLTGEPDAARADAAVTYAMSYGAPVIAMLLGLLVWGEFKGTVQKARMMLVASLVLFMAGLGLVSVAPIY